MIFPILNGILGLGKVPVTWILVALNAAILMITFNLNFEAQNRIETFLDDELFLKTNGQAFVQYVESRPAGHPPLIRNLVEEARSGGPEKIRFLGSLALRDARFMSEARTMEFRGDQVARGWWLRKLDELNAVQARHPSYIFGLNSDDVGWAKWLTYQFVHSGAMHFLGNMIFLFIFGSMLEPIIGGLAVLIVYLGSGMVAAGLFLNLSGVSSIPLVGASGAVSGLMALCCFLFWSRRVRYVYFLFIPKKGYAGFVYLPAWVTFAVWVLSDLAGYLGTMDEIGGVAHAAHLGGELGGVLVGLAVFLIRYRHQTSEIPKVSAEPPEARAA